MAQEQEYVFHKVHVYDLEGYLNTNITFGLSSQPAAEGNDLHGPNILTPTKPEWMKLCGCLLSAPFSLPLWLGAVPCFVAYSKGFGINNLYLGASLSSIATVTGIYSYYHQYKASTRIECIKALVNWLHVKQSVVCKRDGAKLSIPVEDLTVGDIVYVDKGEVVPADIRILEIARGSCEAPFRNGLIVDNSNLTGESEPQSRSKDDRSTHDNPLETKNLAFYATRVVEGSGVGMVVNIGDNTFMGKIVGRAATITYPQTSISKRMDRILFRLRGVTVCVGGSLCVAAYVKNINWLYPVVVGLGLVPTAMYASINASTEPFFSRLASRNCMAKDLEALGNLGTVSTILANKTGTITQGRMTVAHVWLDNKIEEYAKHLEYFDHCYAAKHGGNEWKVTMSSSWKILERVAVLCNNAEFMEGQAGIEDNKISCIGNETDAAILKVTSATTNDSVMEYREKHEKVCEIAFNSSNMFQVSIHKVEDASAAGYLLVMKGAPEKILECCSTVLVDETDNPLNQQLKSDIEDAIEKLASLGERVIGFCDFILPQNEYPIGFAFNADKVNWPMEGFRFVGLMAMTDPPRAAVEEAIYKCNYDHSITQVMVTGDHPITALAIARSVGLIPEGSKTQEEIAELLGDPVKNVNPRDAHAIVMNGKCLKSYTTHTGPYVDYLREEILPHYRFIVFARVTPEQKLLIIEAFQGMPHRTHLQSHKCKVAVTGSDLDDTAALKTADVGIAMGASLSPTTDAVKNAADIILLDDNYANIAYGLEVAKDMLISLKKLPFSNYLFEEQLYHAPMSSTPGWTSSRQWPKPAHHLADWKTY